MALPQLGISQEVRVCDGCYQKKNEGKSSGSSPALTRSSSTANAGSGRKEDDDIQRAIALSLQESQKATGYVPRKASPPPAKSAEEEDPELAAAIAASLKEVNLNKKAAEEQKLYKSDYVAV
jgi:growth factor-regulated tyrosine kinase substrate